MLNGSRVALEPGYLLHRRPYRETSLLLDVFSEAHGRVSIVAHGVRRSKMQAGLLQPFTPLAFSWSGRRELVTLSGVEALGNPHPLTGRCLYGGLYLNELVSRTLVHNDPHPDLFRSYAEALCKLADAQATESTFRVFEKRVLESMGYGLLTDRDVRTGEPLEPSETYYYRLEHGPSRLHSEAEGIAVSGASLIAIKAESFNDADELRCAKQLMRYLLRPHLGEKSLTSRSLYSSPL